MNRHGLFLLGGFLMALLFAQPSSAGNYANIVIDDLYSDWAGIPLADSDPADTPGGIDIADVQVANDDTYIYLHITYHTPNSFNTYYSFDTDNNVATGFNIYGLNLVGSEAAWVNDFDFDQRAGFNIGTLKDGSGNPEPAAGAALLSSFVNSSEREVAIRRDTTFDPFVGPGAVFPGNTFTMLVWTDQGDVSHAISYTLAVPEPNVFALGMLGVTGLATVFRRRTIRGAAASPGIA